VPVVFISYARRDGAEAAAWLDEALHAEGFATWRDTRSIDPTRDFTAELEHAIRTAAAVVTCVTADVERDDSFVRREITYATLVGKPVVVARFEELVPPISVVNSSWFDFFSDRPGALARMVQALRDGAPSAPEPGADRHATYLRGLYEQILRYLDGTVFVPLRGEARAPLLAIGSEDTADAVDAPAEPAFLPTAFFEEAGLTEDATSYGSLGEAFAAHERLLLLGAPGSGKTVSIMAFARDAVTRRLADPDAPLPVLAPISTWQSDPPEAFADWLARVVPALVDAVSGELEGGDVLLLLDGLDELGDERRPTVGEPYDPRPRFLDALPASNQIVLSCREAEYRTIGQLAELGGAVTIRPLADEQLRAYLEPFPRLQTMLDDQPRLKDALRTPLVLSLFTHAYAGAPAAESALADLSEGDLRDAIFGAFVRRSHEREARKAHAEVPFALDELYKLLGWLTNSFEIFLPGGGGWLPPAAFTVEDMDQLTGQPVGAALADLGVRLNVLAPADEQRFRFVHLLLRDHFALPYGRRLLEGEDRVSRICGALIVSELRDAESVPLLIDALGDHWRQVRWTAAMALVRIPDPSAADPLIALLEDRSQPTRLDGSDQTPPAYAQAADALVAIGPAAVEPLIAALEHDHPGIRGGAADVLGRIGDRRAIGPLRELESRSAPEDRAWIVWDQEPVGKIAARALERLQV
jgi:TIR domain/NACHT domain/HEAT repeats